MQHPQQRLVVLLGLLLVAAAAISRAGAVSFEVEELQSASELNDHMASAGFALVGFCDGWGSECERLEALLDASAAQASPALPSHVLVSWPWPSMRSVLKARGSRTTLTWTCWNGTSTRFRTLKPTHHVVRSPTAAGAHAYVPKAASSGSSNASAPAGNACRDTKSATGTTRTSQHSTPWYADPQLSTTHKLDLLLLAASDAAQQLAATCLQGQLRQDMSAAAAQAAAAAAAAGRSPPRAATGKAAPASLKGAGGSIAPATSAPQSPRPPAGSASVGHSSSKAPATPPPPEGLLVVAGAAVLAWLLSHSVLVSLVVTIVSFVVFALACAPPEAHSASGAAQPGKRATSSISKRAGKGAAAASSAAGSSEPDGSSAAGFNAGAAAAPASSAHDSTAAPDTPQLQPPVARWLAQLSHDNGQLVNALTQLLGHASSRAAGAVNAAALNGHKAATQEALDCLQQQIAGLESRLAAIGAAAVPPHAAASAALTPTTPLPVAAPAPAPTASSTGASAADVTAGSGVGGEPEQGTPAAAGGGGASVHVADLLPAASLAKALAEAEAKHAAEVAKRAALSCAGSSRRASGDGSWEQVAFSEQE